MNVNKFVEKINKVDEKNVELSSMKVELGLADDFTKAFNDALNGLDEPVNLINSAEGQLEKVMQVIDSVVSGFSKASSMYDRLEKASKEFGLPLDKSIQDKGRLSKENEKDMVSWSKTTQKALNILKSI